VSRLRRRPQEVLRIAPVVNKTSRLIVESSFIVRMLYEDIYYELLLTIIYSQPIIFLILDCFYFAFCQRSFKRIYDDDDMI